MSESIKIGLKGQNQNENHTLQASITNMGFPGIKSDKGKIISAIKEKKGVVAHAAKSLQLSSECIYEWLKKDSDVAQALTDARQLREKEIIDEDLLIAHSAREGIMELIEKKDTTAIIFALKCKANWAQAEPQSQVDAQQAFQALARKQYSQT